jgi:hypothetical protein
VVIIIDLQESLVEVVEQLVKYATLQQTLALVVAIQVEEQELMLVLVIQVEEAEAVLFTR